MKMDLVVPLPLRATRIGGNLTRTVTVFLSTLLTTNLAFSQDYQAPIVREAKLDACHFKFLDSYQGSLYVYNESDFHSAVYRATFNTKMKYKFETPIRFSCEFSNPETYSDKSMKLTNEGWTIDTSRGWEANASNPILHLLNGKEWHGAGVLHEMSDGNESGRMKYFIFCIPHSLYALCGIARDVAYQSQPNSSVLPQVIKLLESIEFIDDVTETESTLSPSSSPAQ